MLKVNHLLYMQVHVHISLFFTLTTSHQKDQGSVYKEVYVLQEIIMYY